MNSGLHEHIKTFVAIANARGLSKASVNINLGQATISRQLAALEAHLGCRLFHRSTRSINLTEQGEIYLRYALRMLELNEEAEAEVHQNCTRLRGSLRVACSIGFARHVVIPALTQWYEMHPQLHVDLLLSDSLSQIIEERVDVAFRMAKLQESNLIARSVGVSRRILVSTPAYLKKHAPIIHPADLSTHHCILFTGADQLGAWVFRTPSGETSAVRVRGRLKLSTVDAMKDAVLAGLGIAVVPEWFWNKSELNSQVTQLLTEYELPELIIHAIYSSRQNGASKVIQFIDYISQVLSAS
jgi:DNA-binding transcriptional LysR family regulator